MQNQESLETRDYSIKMNHEATNKNTTNQREILSSGQNQGWKQTEKNNVVGKHIRALEYENLIQALGLLLTTGHLGEFFTYWNLGYLLSKIDTAIVHVLRIY